SGYETAPLGEVHSLPLARLARVQCEQDGRERRLRSRAVPLKVMVSLPRKALGSMAELNWEAPVKRLGVSAVVVIGVVLSSVVPASASTTWRVQAVPKPPGSTLLGECPARCGGTAPRSAFPPPTAIRTRWPSTGTAAPGPSSRSPSRPGRCR